MPNWCQNVMYLKKYQDEILIEEIKKGNLCEYILPEPKDKEGEPTDGWYDWRLDNWGTKWDIKLESTEIIEDDDGDAIFVAKFDTAWSSPTELYEEMHKQGYEFEVYYVEYGMEYYGSFVDGVDECSGFPDGNFGPSSEYEYNGWIHPNKYLNDHYA